MGPALLATTALVIGFGACTDARVLFAETATALAGATLLSGRWRPARPDALSCALALAWTAAIALARSTPDPVRLAEALPDLSGCWHAVHVCGLGLGLFWRARGLCSLDLGLMLYAVLATAGFQLFGLDTETHTPGYLPVGPGLALALALALLTSSGAIDQLARLPRAAMSVLGVQIAAAVLGAYPQQSLIPVVWLASNLAVFAVLMVRPVARRLVLGAMAAGGVLLAAMLVGRFVWISDLVGWRAALQTRHSLANLHPNTAGAAQAVVLPLLLARAASHWPFSIAVALAAVAIMLTYSKLALLAAGIGLLFLAFRSPHVRPLVLGVAAIWITIPLLAGREFVGERVSAPTSLGERAVFAGNAMRTFREHPLLGVGPNNHQVQTAHADPRQPRAESQRSLYALDDPHNVVLDVAQGSGVVGLGVLAWLAITMGSIVRAGRGDPAFVSFVAIALMLQGDMALAKHSVLPAELWLLVGTLAPPGAMATRPGAPPRLTVRAAAWLLTVLFALRPAVAGAVIRRARESVLADDTTAAVASWALATRLEPLDARAHWQLGLARLRAGDLPGARASLEAAVRRFPRFGLLRAHLGLIELLGGRIEAGRTELSAAALLDPSGAIDFGHPSFIAVLGAVDLFGGRGDAATPRFVAGLRAELAFAQLEFWLGGGAPFPCLAGSKAFAQQPGDLESLRLLALQSLLPRYFGDRGLGPRASVPAPPALGTAIDELEREATASLAAHAVERALRLFDRVVQDRLYAGDVEAALRTQARRLAIEPRDWRVFQIPGFQRGRVGIADAGGTLCVLVEDELPPRTLDSTWLGFAPFGLTVAAYHDSDPAIVLALRRAAAALGRTPEPLAEHAEALAAQAFTARASAVAMQGLRAMIEQRRGDAELVVRLADRIPDPEAARALIEQAVADRPTLPVRHSMLIALHVHAGRLDDARRAARSAVEACPWSAWMWMLASMRAEASGDEDDALRCAKRAYELDPDSPRVWVQHANLLAARGDLAGAAALLLRHGGCHRDFPAAKALAARLGRPIPDSTCRLALLDRLLGAR